MHERDMVDVIDAIRAGETTAEAEMRLRIARIEALNPSLNAVLDLFADEALAAARKTDPVLPLAGVAVGHKNMVWRKGRRVAYGSKIMETYRAEDTATVNNRLDAAGAIDLASLMMTEFAQGATGHNAHFGAVRNPWNPVLVTGGSSSGSGAAVAAGMVLASFGSDTAGSIRIPASFCGITGLKPTWSRISCAGTMPLSPSFDCIGPLARSARDCARILAIVAGYDARDLVTSRHPLADYEGALDGNLAGQRIGVPRQYFLDGVSASIHGLFNDALDVLKARGAEIIPQDVFAIAEIGICLTLSLRAEVAAQHTDWLRHHRPDYAPQLGVRMMPHASIPAAAYLTAMRKRPEFLKLYADQVFDRVDMIACPTVPVSPPTIAESDLETDPQGALRHYGRIARNTGFASYLGLPALSAPMGFCDRKMPAGLQLIGRPFGEARILKVADAYQRDTAWHLLAPRMAATPEG
jgi:aspartyl-tRNA(Asn)/glutamyl-tRNA(Gln) amidotransferase subunit A